MDRGAWQATVSGVAKSRTQLGSFTFLTFLQNVTKLESGLGVLHLQEFLQMQDELCCIVVQNVKEMKNFHFAFIFTFQKLFK